MEIPTRGPLRDGFRVFAEETGDDTTNVNYSRKPYKNPTLVTIYTDGSCIRDSKGNTAASAGIWFGKEDQRNKAIRILPEIAQTNNTKETIVILKAARSVPKD